MAGQGQGSRHAQHHENSLSAQIVEDKLRKSQHVAPCTVPSAAPLSHVVFVEQNRILHKEPERFQRRGDHLGSRIIAGQKTF